MPNSRVDLHFGNERICPLDVAAERIVAHHVPVTPLDDLEQSIEESLRNPIDFPSFDQTVFPGDRVVLVLDRHTPRAAELIAGMFTVMDAVGVDPECVTILQPADLTARPLSDPRRLLPGAAREKVEWRVHDPTDSASCAYLAATASGRRLYLSRTLTEADVVICVGPVAYDPLLGYRGTSSAIYPGLARVEDIRQAHGQAHDELTFEDSRPLRQAVDEAAWLLGLQFAVQVIPGTGPDVARVLSGQIDSVLNRGRQALGELWRLTVPTRPELVVATISSDRLGLGWEHLASALDVCRRTVAQGGRVVVLTDLDEEPGDGVMLIRESHSPRDALQPIRVAAPPDLVAATQIAKALDWMNVYLLSGLDDDLVEDLYMLPIQNVDEAQRVADSDEPCALIEDAHRVAAIVG